MYAIRSYYGAVGDQSVRFEIILCSFILFSALKVENSCTGFFVENQLIGFCIRDVVLGTEIEFSFKELSGVRSEMNFFSIRITSYNVCYTKLLR